MLCPASSQRTGGEQAAQQPPLLSLEESAHLAETRYRSGGCFAACPPRLRCDDAGHNKWYQSITGLSWDHLLIQGHLLLIGRDRVSISDQRWDCLWDRVSISEQRVKIARGINLEE